MNHFRKTVLAAGVAAVLSLASVAKAGAYEDFFFYVTRDYPSGIKELVAKGFDPNSPDPQGQLGIVIALQEGELKAADAIASSPGFKVNAKNASGETALMMAAIQGNLDWVKRLLAMGADIDQPGWSPVLYAASGPNPEVLKFLLDKGAPLNGVSANGTTPLMMAAQYGAIDGATLLLQRGADPTLRNAQGWTATDFAQRADRDRLAKAIDAASAKAEAAASAAARKN
jgi:ankyrin repeat protein